MQRLLSAMDRCLQVRTLVIGIILILTEQARFFGGFSLDVENDFIISLYSVLGCSKLFL